MPRIIKSQHVLFGKGMIENYKQNIMFENSPLQLDSVLWLENWDPNLEAMTLVKRNGEIRFKEDNLNFDFVYQGLIVPYNNDFSPIQHASLIRSVNPIRYSQFTLICSINANKEELRVFAVEPRIVNGKMAIDNLMWHNAPIDQLPFAGLEKVNGTLGDIVRYGDSLLFCTYSRKNDYSDGVFLPCYVFTRFDISRKRKEGNDKYWNGIDLSLLNLQQKPVQTDENCHLYIKPPIQSLNNLKKNVRRKIVQNWGLDFRTNDIKFTGIGDREYSGSFDDFVVYFQEEKLGSLVATAVSGETTLTNGYLSSMKKPSIAYYYKDTFNVLNMIATYNCPKYRWYKNEAATGDWKLLNTNAYYCKKLDTGSYQLGEALGNMDVIYRTQAELTYFIAIVKSHLLPDYISMKMPRPWVQEDIIPFVVTLTIGGVEYLFYEGNYVVETKNGKIASPDYGYEAHKDYLITLKDYNIAFDLAREVNALGSVMHTVFHDYGTGATLKTQFGAGTYNSPYISGGDPKDVTNTLYYGIRLSEKAAKQFIEIGVTSINLYVSKPSTTRHIVDYTGVISINPIPPTLYSLPITDENIGETDYSKYALVNRFLIEGQGTYDPTDEYEIYRPGHFNMNGWQEAEIILGDYSTRKIYCAVPQDSQGNVKLSTLNLKYNLPQDKADSHTPNFILWDYPSESLPLTLQGTGKYWKGKGARLIHVIQGRTFLAGCIDEEGIEEQGIVRFSQVQSGAIAQDLFNEEDQMRVGYLSHTAFAQFREQLWIFNRQTWYQVIIPIITDYSQWEFVNAVEGQGTFSPKTICTTPFGICFANENGIWMTDGGKPECLTFDPAQGLAIRSLYQYLAVGQTYIYTSLNYIGDSPIDLQLGYNTSMELLYNEEENELVLITPISTEFNNIYDKELRLIYSFSNRNWRAETFTLPVDTLTWSNIHTVHFSYNRFFHTRLNKQVINFSYRNPEGITYPQDIYTTGNTNTEIPIITKLYTHELGDGKDDYLIHSGILEIQSKNINYNYFENRDPILEYQRRNIDWNNQLLASDYGWEDLMLYNMEVKARYGENPFNTLMQTPSVVNNIEALEHSVGRESLHLLAPLNSKFRRLRLRFISEHTIKVRNIIMNIVEMQRKGWG